MKVFILSALCLTLCLLPLDAAAQKEHTHKPHSHRHKEYAKKKNPVPMTDESIAKGKDIFDKHCVTCHGEHAKGIATTDLTDDLWIHGHTDGEIFHVIKHGVQDTAMKGFNKELTVQMHWHLVNYIKSLKVEKKE